MARTEAEKAWFEAWKNDPRNDQTPDVYGRNRRLRSNRGNLPVPLGRAAYGKTRYLVFDKRKGANYEDIHAVVFAKSPSEAIKEALAGMLFHAKENNLVAKKLRTIGSKRSGSKRKRIAKR